MDEEDLWDLIGHLATLAAITKLNDQLQLSPGVKTKLKLNITNIFRKLMGHEAKLTPQETLLVDLAKADAEHLITISKKACNPEKICKYEDFAITRSIQKIIETKLKENGNKHPLSNKMKFCLAIVGKLLMDKYSLTQRERFLESLAAAIHEEHIYEEINDENQERDDTHSNIAQTEHHTNNPHPQTQSPFQTQPMGAHDGIYPHQKSPCVPMIEGLFDTPGYYAATNPFVSPSNTFTFFSQPQTSSHNPTPEAGRSFLY
ncbi:hypothetical protein [Rickettsiella massiliensis]|uniref:hypothetical protein n=1 Tax=Rickettsiella massiliensis TaxID=676517 RepID=UPI00029AEBD4|nr:hypothetical protein [Rickettsiella massiliensis]